MAFSVGLSEEFLHTSLNPIQLETPIYGTFTTKFMNFLAPGFLSNQISSHFYPFTSVLFSFDTGDCACRYDYCDHFCSCYWNYGIGFCQVKKIKFLWCLHFSLCFYLIEMHSWGQHRKLNRNIRIYREKIDGCLDRVFASGVRSTSVICGHFLTHSAVLILQTTLLLIVVVFFFQVRDVFSFMYLHQRKLSCHFERSEMFCFMDFINLDTCWRFASLSLLVDIVVGTCWNELRPCNFEVSCQYSSLFFLFFFLMLPCIQQLIFQYWRSILKMMQLLLLLLLIFSVCDSERDAVQLALASFFPLILLSGVLWPVEAVQTEISLKMNKRKEDQTMKYATSNELNW